MGADSNGTTAVHVQCDIPEASAILTAAAAVSLSYPPVPSATSGISTPLWRATVLSDGPAGIGSDAFVQRHAREAPVLRAVLHSPPRPDTHHMQPGLARHALSLGMPPQSAWPMDADNAPPSEATNRSAAIDDMTSLHATNRDRPASKDLREQRATSSVALLRDVYWLPLRLFAAAPAPAFDVYLRSSPLVPACCARSRAREGAARAARDARRARL